MDIPAAFWWGVLIHIALFLLIGLCVDIRSSSADMRTSLKDMGKTLEAIQGLLERIERNQR
jgi:predicted CDP-diglyceride synthetase/phosphatidate cytidylyltransferase